MVDLPHGPAQPAEPGAAAAGGVGILLDGLIILGYFAVITALGLRLGRRDRDLLGFALGDRRVPWWAVMASIIAAETSAATFLGAPAEGFSRRGVTYVQLTLGLILGRILVGRLFLQTYYRCRVYTVYDYLAIRFGPRTRSCVSALFLVMRLLASGVRLYVPSLVMVCAWRLWQGRGLGYGVTGDWQPYAWAIVLLTVITCCYTALGGIRAVIWTDLLQATLMAGSALLVLGTLVVQIGSRGGGGFSLQAALRTIGAHVPEMTTVGGYLRTGLEGLPPGASIWAGLRHILETPYTLPAALIASTVSNMAAFGTDQDLVQRLLTAPDWKKSRRSLVSAALLDVPVALAFTLIGVLLIVFYDLHPDLRPLKISDVMGVYILSVLPRGLRGLVLAGVFATAMGSLSAALNALGTSFTNDWYMPYLAPHRSQRHYVAAARAATVVAAALMVGIAVAFAYANVRDPTLTILPVALGIAGYVLGPMLGVFLTGLLTSGRGSDRGNPIAVAAGLLAIILCSGRYLDLLGLLLGPGRVHRPAWLPRIEFTWYTLVGAVVTTAVALLFRTPRQTLLQIAPGADLGRV